MRRSADVYICARFKTKLRGGSVQRQLGGAVVAAAKNELVAYYGGMVSRAPFLRRSPQRRRDAAEGTRTTNARTAGGEKRSQSYPHDTTARKLPVAPNSQYSLGVANRNVTYSRAFGIQNCLHTAYRIKQIGF